MAKAVRIPAKRVLGLVETKLCRVGEGLSVFFFGEPWIQGLNSQENQGCKLGMTFSGEQMPRSSTRASELREGHLLSQSSQS